MSNTAHSESTAEGRARAEISKLREHLLDAREPLVARDENRPGTYVFCIPCRAHDGVAMLATGMYYPNGDRKIVRIVGEAEANLIRRASKTISLRRGMPRTQASLTSFLETGTGLGQNRGN